MTVLMRTLAFIATLSLVASCTAPSEEEVDPAGDAATNDTATDGESEAASQDESRVALANTAWRIEGEDGAIYTTYLDADGTYRDFKNGDPFQDGTWEEVSEARLCFKPTDEERQGECWTTDRQKSDGTMRTTSDSDHTVELRQVTYVAASQDSE